MPKKGVGIPHGLVGGIESLRVYRDFDLSIYESYISAIPPSPHNLVLQIWMDLGGVGIAFALVFVYGAWKFVGRIDRVNRPAILAAITMIFVAVCVTRSMWASWWLASVAFVLLILYLIQKNSQANADFDRYMNSTN